MASGVVAWSLRGIFLCGNEEVDWFLYGMGRFFPEAWRKFAEGVPDSERGDLLAAYQQRLEHSDPEVSITAARGWAAYEATCSTLRPNGDAVAAMGEGTGALALARLEAHYLAHNAFPGGRRFCSPISTSSAICLV